MKTFTLVREFNVYFVGCSVNGLYETELGFARLVDALEYIWNHRGLAGIYCGTWGNK